MELAPSVFRQALQRLASSAQEQETYLVKLGTAPSADELALEYSDALGLVQADLVVTCKVGDSADGRDSRDQSIGASEMKLIYEALLRVRDRTLEDGPQAFHDPAVYPGYVTQVARLIQMLERDRRVTGAK